MRAGTIASVCGQQLCRILCTRLPTVNEIKLATTMIERHQFSTHNYVRIVQNNACNYLSFTQREAQPGLD